MKTEAIKQSILNNYNIIKEKANVGQKQDYVIDIWRLQYKEQGSVNRLGMIERKGTKIDIRDGEVILKDKPFYTMWKINLKRVNKMLEEIIANINNEQIVTKTVVNFLTYPRETINRLSKIKR